jgi:hypothetical protein
LMLHLTTRLTREIWYLVPSHLHQMFPYERSFGFLKSLAHNYLFSKGAIVPSYETIEVVEWTMGYMDTQNPIGVPRSLHECSLSGVGTLGINSVTPGPDAFQKAHFTVIQQLHRITPFANEHKRQLHQKNSDHGRAWLTKMHMQDFNRWLRDYVETCSNVVITNEIRNLATRPLFTVTKY